MTTYDDFVSNFVSGYADGDTGKGTDYQTTTDLLNRNARFTGYAEGFDAWESGKGNIRDSQADIENLADEAWAEYNG